MRAYTWQPLCKHEAVWFCPFHRLKYTKTHAKRQLRKLLITRPWKKKKAFCYNKKLKKRGSQNVNVFARAYLVTHKFLAANIGYAYLFQLFGFHKSLAFCFRVSLALCILAFFSLAHFFVEKSSNSTKTWENNEKAISPRDKSFNKMQTEIKQTNISKRLKRSWNLYAKNAICIQKIVLLSERYFYITVSLNS